MINRLNQEFPSLPEAFFNNKIRWCNLLLKTKEMQGLFGEFSHAIAKCLELEIKHNRDLIDKYMKHPRPQTRTKTDLIELYQAGAGRGFQTWDERNKNRKIIPKMMDFKLLVVGKDKKGH